MSEVSEKVMQFLEKILPVRIIGNNREFQDCNIIECTAKSTKSLDGFLSTMFQVQLVLQDKVSERKRQTLTLIVKMLKNLETFREQVNADEMTFNELVFYANIMPLYAEMIENGGLSIKTDWTPKFYYGFYGLDKDLGDGKLPEGVFVFENLTSTGYRMGPRDKLDEKHIMLMTESIAQLHAASYALKFQNRKKFDEFVASFRAYPFESEKKNMFDGLYDIALERLFRHVSSTDQPTDYKAFVIKVYQKYIKKPSSILQQFLEDDADFNIIIHGDYNRNNVMFKYESSEGFENPMSVKMFDFQWVKYASPVLDLSFYLYMNLDPTILETSWDKILKYYHETLITAIAEIMKCDETDERLVPLSYELFLKHFARYAFYGCTISAWFLPIMLCDLEGCKNIEMELNKDLHSEESKIVCLPAGGKDAIDRVNNNVMHAFNKGYMKRLLN